MFQLTSRQNLIIMAPQLLSKLTPRIKMRLDINCAAHTLLLPNAPKLLESRRAINARLVGARGLQDIVGAAVGGDGTLFLSSRSGVVGTVGLDNVVLDQGVARPAVERDVAVDGSGVPGARVGDVADAAGVPALAGDKVADVRPGDVVLGVG
jgi:hypothetical protein